MRRNRELPLAARRPSLLADDSGASTIEFALLMAGIALPAYWIFRVAFAWLISNYQMLTLLNGWPFP